MCEAQAIHTILRRHAAETPEAIALLAPHRAPLTYARLWSQILEATAVACESGVAPGDRVALVLPDGPEMAVAFLAVSAVATAAPINPQYRQAEFERSFEDLRITWLLTSAPADSAVIHAAKARKVEVVRLAIDETKPAGILRLDGTRHTSALNDFASGSDVALILTTSGTTSRPKIVALTHANILASAGNIAASLELRAEDRCQVVMPLFHVHGLIGGVLASLTAGASVICCPGFDAPCFFEWMDQGQPTWYTAVPTMHQAILTRARQHRDVIARRRLRLVRSASAFLPETLQRALEEEFGAPVIQAYGMTEASHQIAQNPLPPAKRKPGSVGLPLGTAVAILDEASTPRARGLTGEIAIRGPNVIAAYEGGGAANAQSFVDGWLKTGDAGHIDNDGYVFITGRLKETINRGGEKVNPREVDEVLLTHPAVAEAAAFGMSHATLGQDVAAAVVLHEGRTCTEQALREFAAGRLAQFKVPARVIFLDELPEGPTGKVQRSLLADQLGIHSAPLRSGGRPAFAAPDGRFETSLAVLWSESLGVASVGRLDNFFELGGDSIAGARLLGRVERDLGASISFVALFDRPVLCDMARAIADHASGERDDGAPASGPPLLESPVSFGQERLWLLDQLRPGSVEFNSSIRLRIKGPLLVQAMQQSLTTLVNRHDVLRTTFPAVDGRPVQRTAARVGLSLEVVDLRSSPSSDRTAELDRRIAAGLYKPFDLARGPLVRATLFALDQNDHALIIAIHHIVCDGWSRSIFLGELGVIYEQVVRGEPVSLHPLPFQYGEYARREVASGELIDRHLAFWVKQLANLPRLNLPYDGPCPETADVRAECCVRLLPRSLTHSIRALSRHEGATPFMTLLAAFSILLSRLSGSKDVVIGSPIAGRTSVETETLIGFFVKTLILRVDLSGTPSFRDLLQRVRTVTLNALSHQEVPFQRLVNALKPARVPNRNPLFDVTINFRNFPESDLGVAGLESQSISLKEHVSEFALTMDIANEDDTLSVQLMYQPALFTSDRVAVMLDQFEFLLRQIVTEPTALIDAYSWRVPSAPSDEVGATDRQTLLANWNDTRAVYPAHLGLHQLFEAQVDLTPEAIAVVSGEDAVSFAALNARANQLARVLRSHDIARDAVIGVCLERSIDLVVALLGVLKAGAAYLPLDPNYPEARLRLMLEDARAPIILTESSLTARLPSGTARLLCLDQDRASMASEASGNLENITTPDSLAYVLFTSGSTGRAKGVMIPHRAVCNYIWWMGSAIPFTRDDRVLQRTPISFDISVWEIFTPLSFGATLV
ncbi:MAG: AMP-binding protein, partial [Vicinamibacterales bacterium]